MNFSTWMEQKIKGKRRKKGDWVIVLLIGVLLMVIAIPAKDGKEKKEVEAEDTSNEQEKVPDNSREYVQYLEKRLEETLEKMSGVGDVSVMITLKDEGTSVLDKDVAISEKESQESTVIFSDDDATKPFVTQQQYPGVEGVVVVAEGAGISGLGTDITECVMALFHIEAHKVKVLQMGK